MSAIVCGKRSHFEEFNLNGGSTSSPSSSASSNSSSLSNFKKIRFCSSISSPRSHLSSSSVCHSSSLIQQLAALFPDMGNQLLERALVESGDDLDLAIKSLNELCLGSNNIVRTCILPSEIDNDEVHSCEDTPNVPADRSEWVELFVGEMMNASNMDDARVRASRALDVLEKSIPTKTEGDVAKELHQENALLKEQVQVLIQENTLLKRTVTVQFERQKEFESQSHELQELRHMVTQYQEQLRTLEVNNYALSMHLKQAQQNSSIPGRFHPDVF